VVTRRLHWRWWWLLSQLRCAAACRQLHRPAAALHLHCSATVLHLLGAGVAVLPLICRLPAVSDQICWPTVELPLFQWLFAHPTRPSSVYSAYGLRLLSHAHFTASMCQVDACKSLLKTPTHPPMPLQTHDDRASPHHEATLASLDPWPAGLHVDGALPVKKGSRDQQLPAGLLHLGSGVGASDGWLQWAPMCLEAGSWEEVEVELTLASAVGSVEALVRYRQRGKEVVEKLTTIDAVEGSNERVRCVRVCVHWWVGLWLRCWFDCGFAHAVWLACTCAFWLCCVRLLV
jgi:hypothetical protein